MKNKLCCTVGLSLLTLLGASWPLAATAKVFRNSYLSFEMPDTWDCKLETTEWVCRATLDKESKEAIIILTAKEVGPTDSLAAYQQHLGTPQATTYKGAPSALSQVKYPPKQTMINDQVWVDGLHASSEVPNYFTRYLATIKGQIAVLFTCSAHKDYYSKYNSDFFKAVNSLRVIATKDLLSQPNNGVKPSTEKFGVNGIKMPTDIMNAAEQDVGTDPNTQGSGNASKSKNLLIGIALVLAAIGAYVFLKSKRS